MKTAPSLKLILIAVIAFIVCQSLYVSYTDAHTRRHTVMGTVREFVHAAGRVAAKS